MKSLISLAVLTATPAMADHRTGILTYGGRDSVLTTPHEEVLCIIVAPADKARVLRAWPLGHRCTVSGKTEL